MISYRAGYKYQLVASYSLVVEISPAEQIMTDFIVLDVGGLLTINNGYAWDGASGPAIDTKNFMRGSLVHDALYQLMRGRNIGQEHRKTADQILRRICQEDGMSAIRAWWVYQGVRFGGGHAADPDKDNPVLTAP